MLLIDGRCYEQMLAHLQAVYPQEGCGFLAGGHGRAHIHFPITNIDQSSTTFQMAPQEQIEALMQIDEQGTKLLAIYHSHPHSRAYPSASDIAAAFYPDAAYLIASFQVVTPDVKGFLIRGGRVEPLPIETV